MRNETTINLNEYRKINVTADLTIGDLIDHIHNDYPDLANCLAPERLNMNELITILKTLDEESSVFEGGDRGGRGDGYRKGQRVPGVRKTGIAAINAIIGDNRRVIIDILAGDGTLARTLKYLNVSPPKIILCCDSSASMVTSAFKQGQAAWRQSATSMLLNDACTDAVTFLYGTHHIPRERLGIAFREAYRILRPNGRIVVQDFEEGSPTAQWFSVVIHKWTPQGHAFHHYHRGELADELRAAGFKDVEEHTVYDPLEVNGATREEAEDALLYYVATTWELTRITSRPDGRTFLQSLINEYGRCEPNTWNHTVLTEPGILKQGNGYEAVMPRMSLFAWGTKR